MICVCSSAILIDAWYLRKFRERFPAILRLSLENSSFIQFNYLTIDISDSYLSQFLSMHLLLIEKSAMEKS